MSHDISPSADPAAGANCPTDAEAGSESPEVAFQRYAEAINHGDWCEAASTFAVSARLDLAEANFKALILLAGAANPKREGYQAQLMDFCSKHALSCQDPKWIEQAAADMMTGTDVAPKLAEFRQFASDGPAQVYRDLTLHMGAVDASVLTKFEPVLREVQVTAAKATAEAIRQDGSATRINLVKTETGWVLTVR